MSRRRIRLTLLAFTAALPASASASVAPATAPTQAPGKPPALGVVIDSCDTGLLAVQRAAVFTASMPSVPESVSMAMRFDLEERDGSIGPYLPLAVPNFGRWERSQPGVAGFVYSKRVLALIAPAAYRVKVRFRWLDAGGATVKSAHRTSALCRQPDLRPDLRVSRLHVGKASGGGGLYSVTVRNAGASAVATPFLVAVRAGAARRQQEVAALAAGAAVTFVFRAPRCVAGTPVVARVDPGRAVDEANEHDNLARTSCPA